MGFTGDFTVGEVGERDRKNIFREMLVEITYPEPGVKNRSAVFVCMLQCLLNYTIYLLVSFFKIFCIRASMYGCVFCIFL